MAQLKVKTIGDTTIYVNDEGKFFAEIDGRITRRSSLRALERIIEKRQRPIHVMIPRREWTWGVGEDEIAGTVGDNLRGSKGKYSRYGEAVYLYDEEAMTQFKALLEEYKDLCTRWDAVKAGLTKVTKKNLEELRTPETGS